jgi:hypothetical protein
MPSRDKDRGFNDVVKSLGDRRWPPRGLVRLVDTVPDALAALDEPERVVIELTYWPPRRPSDRKIGRYLHCDHKTVKRRHETAMVKLRLYYREALEKDCSGRPKRAFPGVGTSSRSA